MVIGVEVVMKQEPCHFYYLFTPLSFRNDGGTKKTKRKIDY